MHVFGWGDLSPEPNSELAAKTKLRYPNLFSLNGKHLLGTREDWLTAFWGGNATEVALVEIPDDFYEPVMLLRDMRGIMNSYLQTHVLDCGEPHCTNCIRFVRKPKIEQIDAPIYLEDK